MSGLRFGLSELIAEGQITRKNHVHFLKKSQKNQKITKKSKNHKIIKKSQKNQKITKKSKNHKKITKKSKNQKIIKKSKNNQKIK